MDGRTDRATSGAKNENFPDRRRRNPIDVINTDALSRLSDFITEDNVLEMLD